MFNVDIFCGDIKLILVDMNMIQMQNKIFRGLILKNYRW